MTGIVSLWLPILLSSVFVFVASSIIHMMLPWHKNDFLPVPNEDKLRDAVRPLAIPPGDYMVPRPATPGQMKSPEFQEKMKQGPVMILTMMPSGVMSMGKNLVNWFIYCAVVGIFSAYIAGRALPHGTPYLIVFRFVGAAAFIGYSLALWQNSIWYRRPWSTTFKANVDGLIYACLTAGTFGWLWPK